LGWTGCTRSIISTGGPKPGNGEPDILRLPISNQNSKGSSNNNLTEDYSSVGRRGKRRDIEKSPLIYEGGEGTAEQVLRGLISILGQPYGGTRVKKKKGVQPVGLDYGRNHLNPCQGPAKCKTNLERKTKFYSRPK